MADSNRGGTEAVWARNGGSFSIERRQDDGHPVETKPAFSAAKPRVLFEARYETATDAFDPNYDVSPDGQRFLMVKTSKQEPAAAQINVVLNWFEDPKHRVSTAK
jgi:hypothetical protein